MDPTPKARIAVPHLVFAAGYLFSGVGMLALTAAVGGLFAIAELSYLETKQAHEPAAGALAALGLVVYAMMGIAYAGLCQLMAALTGRGSAVARIFVWILAGLGIVFNLVLLSTGAYKSVPWYGDLTRFLAVATLPLAAASVVLLALPVSHRFFREVKAVRRQRQPLRPDGQMAGRTTVAGAE